MKTTLARCSGSPTDATSHLYRCPY